MSVNCKNCFLLIEDMRKETRCCTCNSPLHKDCAIKDGGTFYCDVCYTVKEEGDALEESKIIIPDVIRRSYIETYKSCPHKFYLEVIKGIKTYTSCYAQIGIDLHNLFHQAGLELIMNADVMKEMYKGFWDKYDDALFEVELHLYKDMSVKELRKKLWQQSMDSIDTFFKIISDMPKTPLTLEENIIFSVGETLPKVSITMDRVDEIDGMLEVSDWKTGTVIVGKKISSDLQAPLYIKAIKEHFNKSVRKFNFYYLPENKIRTFERVDDENYTCVVNKREYQINLTDAIREVQHIFSQIKNNNFNIPRDTKKMFFLCKTCGFKAKGICQGADLESWRQYNGGGS